MSSGPVHNGGAFFLANGAATEVRRRTCGVAAVGWRWSGIGGRGRTRMPRLELMSSPGRVSVVPEPTRDNDASDAPPTPSGPSRWRTRSRQP